MTTTRSPYLFVSYAETNRIFREPYQKYLAALSIAALLAMPAFSGSYMLHLFNLAFLATIGAIGLNLLSGYCGQVSLGHAGFLAIGAFSTVFMVKYLHAPFWVAVPVSCLVGALLGFVVGLPALRFRGIYLAIATLAMHYAIVFLLTTYQVNFSLSATAGITIPTATLGPIVISTERAWYYLLFLVVGGVVVFALNLVRTRPGRAWIAIRDRDIAAESLGIHLARYKLLAFMTGSALASLAGSLGAYFSSVVTIEEFTIDLAISYVAMIIVGGMGSILGSIFGATFITLLPFAIDYIFGFLPSAWRYGSTIFGVQVGAVGLCIIGFLLFEPKGLAEIYRNIAVYFERWPFRYRQLDQGRR